MQLVGQQLGNYRIIEEIGRGGMAVRAKQGFTRDSKSLKVYLMADTIAWSREVDSETCSYTLEESMIVGILKSCLQGVVINIAHR